MKTKRRQFLMLSVLFGISPYLNAKELNDFEKSFKKVEFTIASVQAHLFPKGSKFPSAEEMNTIQFLFDTVVHKSFDKDIRAFIIEGAKEFMSREKGHFLTMSTEEKEKALREYEVTNYGSSWLKKIMTITMEGMFSDPIYGSNVKEAGWKTLNSYGGQPRPSTRYLNV